MGSRDSLRARLDISIDGNTIVANAGFDVERNQRRIRLQPGLGSFLNMFSQSGEIGNIISRKPDAEAQREIVGRALTRLYLDDFFPRPSSVVLAGSARQEAHYMIERSRNRNTLLIDAEPQLIGAPIVSLLHDQGSEDPIRMAIGVTDVPEQEERIDQLLTFAGSIPGVDVSTPTPTISHIDTGGGRLIVVSMNPYTMGEASDLRLITALMN